MKRLIRIRQLVALGIVATALLNQAAADPPDILRDYRFISSHTVVHVSGGFPGYNMDLSIQGKFGLVTGYDYEVSPTAHIPTLVPHAEFVDVHAILFNPLSLAPLPVPGWDLDKTLNLSGLKGTFQNPNTLHFSGLDGQGVPIKLDAVLHGSLLHLTGENSLSCAGCADLIGYKVDALAHLTPYADFNLDGVVDRNDLHVLMADIGTTTGGSFEKGDANGDGKINGDDFLAWQRSLGAATNLGAFADSAPEPGTIPEPTTLALLLAGAGFVGLRRTRSLR